MGTKGTGLGNQQGGRFPLGPLLIVGFFVLLTSARGISGFAIEWAWWKELGQLDTYISMLGYGTLPVVGAAVLAFLVLWIVHARALKYAGTGLRRHRAYGWVATLVIAVVSIVLASVTID